jgi:hypothetical protein
MHDQAINRPTLATNKWLCYDHPHYREGMVAGSTCTKVYSWGVITCNYIIWLSPKGFTQDIITIKINKLCWWYNIGVFILCDEKRSTDIPNKMSKHIFPPFFFYCHSYLFRLHLTIRLIPHICSNMYYYKSCLNFI